MAYCRWSTDNHQCDLYVYQYDGGYSINVAALRYSLPCPAWSPPDPLQADPYESYERHRKAVDKWRKKVRLEPIGLPEDGATYDYENAQEAIDKLWELWKMGYKFPVLEVVKNIAEDAIGDEIYDY